jgi:hypothetical protein
VIRYILCPACHTHLRPTCDVSKYQYIRCTGEGKKHFLGAKR